MSRRLRIITQATPADIAAGNRASHDIWSDGSTMWVVDYWADKIYAYSMAGM